jgi:hypothetical protein
MAIPACGWMSYEPPRTQLCSRAHRSPSSVTSRELELDTTPPVNTFKKERVELMGPAVQGMGPMGSRTYPSGPNVWTIPCALSEG